MNAPLKNMRLPADRVDQLRQFADGMDKATLSQAIGKLMQLARQEGLVEHSIPSVTINRLLDGLTITLKGGSPVGFSFEEAQGIADTMRKYLADRSTNERGQIVVRMFKTHGGSFSILGRGNGVKVAMPVGSEPFMFTPDLVADFADLIEHEAVKAKA